MRKLKHQTGFGLLELMLSMVIVALLLIMATRYYQSARTNSRVNQAISELAEILNAANNIAIGSGAYTNATSTTIKPYLSAGEVDSSGNIINPWYGTVTVAGAAANVTITSGGLGGDCQKLLDAVGNLHNTNYYVTYSCTDGNTFKAVQSLTPSTT